MEALEGRHLLSAAHGSLWPDGRPVTYSFMPDGTDIGGMPSALHGTLDERVPAWQEAFHEAAAMWSQATGIPLVLVADDGSPLGVAGQPWGDPRFGDIRIGGTD